METRPARRNIDRELMAEALRQWDDETRSAESTPDWAKWRAVPVVRLYEAVALSCAVDPIPLSDTTFDFWESILPVIQHKARSAANIVLALGEANAETSYLLVNRGRKQVEDRLFVAERNLGDNEHLPCVTESTNVVFSMVRLADFALWARKIGWTIPKQLEDLAGPPRLNQWPWGSHSTDLLQKLDASVRKFWINYSPDDPSTAPTDKIVIDWIMKTYGLSHPAAQCIARIIRADHLPSGPRRAR